MEKKVYACVTQPPDGTAGTDAAPGVSYTSTEAGRGGGRGEQRVKQDAGRRGERRVKQDGGRRGERWWPQGQEGPPGQCAAVFQVLVEAGLTQTQS